MPNTVVARGPGVAPSTSLRPTPSQRAAIEAEARPLLVLAGPGAGKTFCLIERIHHLVHGHGIDPARICAFTFTNKAAGEIAHRLSARLGLDTAERVRRGTIHAFCAELLREHGAAVGLERGFGIADEDYQLSILRRIEGPRRFHKNVLSRFAAHRFRGEPLHPDDQRRLEIYERHLARMNLADFDMLVLRCMTLLEETPVVHAVRDRFDAILVDEFQDLNPVQYRILRALASEHRHVFAVGDDEQSIYSWAGADPSVFRSYSNDFGIAKQIHLDENRRCPRQVMALAQRLINVNTPIFAHRERAPGHDHSPFPVTAVRFDGDEQEIAWLVSDLRRDREAHALPWGAFAVLYRQHTVGHVIESALLNAGIPCRLAQGRALSDDPIVGYVLAALRVINAPGNDVYRDGFFKAILPTALFDEARARAESARQTLLRQLNHLAARLPKSHGGYAKVHRALHAYRNLAALGRRHTTLLSLISEVLSHKVGQQRSILEERHDELSDPQAYREVRQLADRLEVARARRAAIVLPRSGGAEVPVRTMLQLCGFLDVQFGTVPPDERSMCVAADETPSLGFALGLFKALQLLEARAFESGFSEYTAVDLETTSRDADECEIIEIAAARVRDGRVIAEFNTLVRPTRPIPDSATRIHGITDADVAPAPPFDDVWPRFRAFCGTDVVVAHNGYSFDFRVLKRYARAMGKPFDLTTYDSLLIARELFPTSRRLQDLAEKFEVPTGEAHRALDDVRTLAGVFTIIEEHKLSRARKTALVNLLGHLGVALALAEERLLPVEARLFRDLARFYALGRYSGALEAYEDASTRDETLPAVDEVISRLGGPSALARVRAEKSADDRYPMAMQRMRRLLADLPTGALDAQITAFLERVALSQWDGHDKDDSRVNLFTLHATKGLEFSRVYVVGVEDAQMPGGSATRAASPAEVEEARRLLYVGMTRAQQRLVLTHAAHRSGKPSGGHKFLDEMGLAPATP